MRRVSLVLAVSLVAAAISATATVACGGGPDGVATSSTVGSPGPATLATRSPSGLRPLLTYTSFRGRMDAADLTPDKLPDLFLVTPDGQRAGRVTRTLAWEANPAWAPDGNRIAYARGDTPDIHAGSLQGPGATSIWVVRSDGAGARRLTNGDNPERSTFDERPAWSPDGRQIAFLRGSLDEQVPSGIYVVGVGKSQVRRVASDSEGPFRTFDWSPDGKTIAAVSFDERLQLINVANGRVTDRGRLPASGRGSLKYSPNGQDLAIGGNQGLYILRLSDRRVRRVVRANDVASVSWSPNGQTIAFTALGPTDFDVFVVGRSGRKLQRLTKEGVDGEVDWRP